MGRDEGAGPLSGSARSLCERDFKCPPSPPAFALAKAVRRSLVRRRTARKSCSPRLQPASQPCDTFARLRKAPAGFGWQAICVRSKAGFRLHRTECCEDAVAVP